MSKIKKQLKALVLVSGGLDSMLAAEILKQQGYKIKKICFKSYFFGPCVKNAKIINISKEHLKIVKNPKYGHGKNLNPCIDCHLLMLKKAKKLADKLGYDFVATGEIQGQRPFSQNKQALDLIQKKSGLGNRLLRPLNFIQGRSRKKQLALAKKYNLKNFSSPAGGCLLTDKQFSQRLKKFLDNKINNFELLKFGRHIWSGKSLIIIGRNHEENLKIKKLAQKNDKLIELKKYPGPLTLLRGKALGKAKKLTKYYSVKARNIKEVEFKID